MRITTLLLTGFAFVGTLGGAGCGAGNGVAPFSSGIEGSRTITSLSPAEQQQFCTSDAVYSSQATAAELASSCRSSALSSSQTRTAADPVAACNTQYNNCIANNSQQDPSPVAPDDGGCQAALAIIKCPLTVGELETCLNQAAAGDIQAAAAIPGCDQASSTYQLPDSTRGGGDAPCFQDILTKCPELLEGQTTTGGGNGGSSGGGSGSTDPGGSTGTGGAAGAPVIRQ